MHWRGGVCFRLATVCPHTGGICLTRKEHSSNGAPLEFCLETQWTAPARDKIHDADVGPDLGTDCTHEPSESAFVAFRVPLRPDRSSVASSRCLEAREERSQRSLTLAVRAAGGRRSP
ncbi:hypothetical protein HPB47_002551 [Ixodes persulcatus]|uniref:Uncharacterized protein n=1 Tax=Ixodes persulcatus TaxID=34615 RepID=A0AC60PKZ4_IXOPE|nr:hypothetical protein HPB47_002551 [Ixodes persulcatus]